MNKEPIIYFLLIIGSTLVIMFASAWVASMQDQKCTVRYIPFVHNGMAAVQCKE